MKEIISLHIGQGGIQTGNSMWELICAEHGIGSDGVLYETSHANECFETFYKHTVGNKYVPRCLMLDLEPSVIDQIRTGSFRQLFHPDLLMNGPEDASSNFARGFFTIGKLIISSVENQIRKLIEGCTGIQGILIFRSLGGGTGSGLTSAIFESLASHTKLTKIEVPIYPSPTLSMLMVEPYNSILGEHFCMEDIDVGLLFDNEALYDMCRKYLNFETTTYNTINRLMAQVISSITASIRFENVLSCDITVMQTNLVPYPRIHFPLCNFAPLVSNDKVNHVDLNVENLTRLVFERDNQMLKVDHGSGKYMSCTLFYRGDVSPNQVYNALAEVKSDKSIHFVDWCPTGFKVGINVFPPVTVASSHIASTSRNVAMMTNTSAIGQAWSRLTDKFYALYNKKAFVHWYIGEGMEEIEFEEGLMNLGSLVNDYNVAAADEFGDLDGDEMLLSAKEGEQSVQE